MGILLRTYDSLLEYVHCLLTSRRSLGNMYFIGLITLLVSNQSIDQFYR